MGMWNENDFVVSATGWGVQSMTVNGMVALGEIDPIHAAVHSDTTHERGATYAYAKKWTPWLEERGVHVVTVSDEYAARAVYRDPGRNDLHIPAYTLLHGVVNITPDHLDEDELDGMEIVDENIDDEVPIGTRKEVSHGMLNRACTQRWKIAPIRRWLQANRDGRHVTQLFGISKDEWQRAKDSDVGYVTNVYPLLDREMTRNDCVNWLERHGIEVPTKSACVFCPYHNRRAWQEMKQEGGADWEKAVAIDETIRNVRHPYEIFVNSARIPLRDVDLSTPEDHGQMALWQETCESGYCWV